MANKVARQAGNMTLLSQTLAEQALLDYYERSPGTADDDPRPRIGLLEEARALAQRYAPPIVRMVINGWLAEDRAVANDGYGADEALERSQAALEKAKLEGPSETGFCSSAGHYNGWGEGKLERFRGAVEVTLNPSSALSTIEASLELTTNLRGRAYGLVYLTKALIACKQPQEACDCLAEAHTIGRTYGSVTILHHFLSARGLMPLEWNRLKCVRELDELVGGVREY
jgi:hypothetical protein